jgi:hypothetical protein
MLFQQINAKNTSSSLEVISTKGLCCAKTFLETASFSIVWEKMNAVPTNQCKKHFFKFGSNFNQGVE